MTSRLAMLNEHAWGKCVQFYFAIGLLSFFIMAGLSFMLYQYVRQTGVSPILLMQQS